MDGNWLAYNSFGNFLLTIIAIGGGTFAQEGVELKQQSLSCLWMMLGGALAGNINFCPVKIKCR